MVSLTTNFKFIYLSILRRSLRDEVHVACLSFCTQWGRSKIK